MAIKKKLSKARLNKVRWGMTPVRIKHPIGMNMNRYAFVKLWNYCNKLASQRITEKPVMCIYSFGYHERNQHIFHCLG